MHKEQFWYASVRCQGNGGCKVCIKASILVILSSFFVIPAACKSEAITPQIAMGFEAGGAWSTEADLISEFKEPELWCSKDSKYAILAGGVEISSDHVKVGKFSGKWADHPRFPTIWTKYVPTDWSGYESISLWIYSELATNEQIVIAPHSDSNGTPYKDFFMHPFTVDWKGWKQISIPLSDFEACGKPAGWDHINALYFYTKILNRSPNPYTVLYLDDIRLQTGTQPVGAANKKNRIHQFDTRLETAPFDMNAVNHAFAETPDNRPIFAPLKYEPYFHAERAVYQYYPKFVPAPVSFDPNGKAFMKYASYIETLGKDGKWQVTDLTPFIDECLKGQYKWPSYELIYGGFNDETKIRFDNDGDAYAIALVNGPHGYMSLLLHSHDGMKTWKGYVLSCPWVRFEKPDGHNQDCLKRPPVILMADGRKPYQAGYILIPEKRSDGTLSIPEAVKICDDCVIMGCHSGDGNSGITHGDNVYIVWGAGYHENNDQSKWPQIPNKEKHPQYNFSYTYIDKTVYSRDGMPAFAVVFNIKTKQVSKPVFVGWGAHTADDHNWAEIAMDSKGYLHVIVNGHQTPFTYTVSKKPLSIDEWEPPTLLSDRTSYATLNCDKDDTIYVVTRCSKHGWETTGNELMLLRKKQGQPWDQERYLVTPGIGTYKNWIHKMTFDVKTGRLFLSYFAQGRLVQFYKDDLLSFENIWPDSAMVLLINPEFNSRKTGYIPAGTYKTAVKQQGTFAPPLSEPCLLVSEDKGDSWRLAVTNDFK
jgi:hypothetical protein